MLFISLVKIIQCLCTVAVQAEENKKQYIAFSSLLRTTKNALNTSVALDQVSFPSLVFLTSVATYFFPIQIVVQKLLDLSGFLYLGPNSEVFDYFLQGKS